MGHCNCQLLHTARTVLVTSYAPSTGLTNDLLLTSL